MIPLDQLPYKAIIRRPIMSIGQDWIGPSDTEYVATVDCLISSLADRAELLPIGNFASDRFVMFTQPGVNVQFNDEVEIDGNMYKVSAPPRSLKNPADGWADHHMEIEIREVNI